MQRSIMWRVVFSGVLLFGFADVAAADEYLNDAGLKPLFADTIRTGTAPDGTPWVIHANAAGTETLVAGKKKDFKDSATYVIRDNTICETWTKVEDGKETCWHVKKTGDNEYVAYKMNGARDSSFSVAPQ